jgi:hypothetical protein
MAGGIASFPGGVQGVYGGVSALSTNSRVTTSMGPLILVTDVMQVGTITGNWAMGNQRVFVNGVPTIGQTSFGIAMFGNVPAPMLVVQADSRVFAM